MGPLYFVMKNTLTFHEGLKVFSKTMEAFVLHPPFLFFSHFIGNTFCVPHAENQIKEQ